MALIVASVKFLAAKVAFYEHSIASFYAFLANSSAFWAAFCKDKLEIFLAAS